MSLPKIWLICRICLKQNYGMLNLYTTHCDLPIWNVLRDVGGIPVRKDDNFSDKICEACFDRLWKAHGFRLDCQRAHREITQVVQYGGKKYSELLPEVAVIDSARFSLDVEHFQSAKSNSFCFTYEDLNNHNPDPGAESKANDNQISTINEAITNGDGNFLNKDNSNLNDHVILVEAIDFEKAVKANKTQIDLKAARQKAPKSTKHRNIEDTTKGLLKVAPNNVTSSRAKIYCNICKNIFSSKTMLRQHMYIHTKPHTCRLCGKTFSHKRHIKDHLNTHYGVRPYSCRLCPSRFADISNRNKHERTVHKRERLHNYAKPKVCLVCDIQFATVFELRNHLNMHLKPVFKEETV